MCIRAVVAKGLFAALVALCIAPASILLGGGVEGLKAQAQTIREVRVEGNRRVEPETVRSYLQINPGDSYDPYGVDSSLKALFATGLFSDVNIRRENDVLVVSVVENPIVNRVAFEGNSEIEDATLRSEVQTNPRSVFTRARVQADVQRILEVYRRSGLFGARVEPKIIHLEHNRVDLVFEITEGVKTTVRRINFVGNDAFTDSQLRDVVSTTETGLLSFLRPTNIYDPDRLNLDRELLRQFYLKNGYADVRVLSAVADLDREGRGFYISFTVHEGEQYRFGAVDIESSLVALDTGALMGKIETRPGQIYDASKVDKSIENLTLQAAEMGYAFARVVPRPDRDPLARTIGLVYTVEEGPRVYIERIEISGNVRTEDEVIRREFRLAEGDAFNRLLVDGTERKLRNLGYFKSVNISVEPGSHPDRVVIKVTVEEQPTGELSFGAGYSTADGIIGDISLTERNLLGKGQFVRLRFAGSLERYQVDFSFTQPHFLDRNMSAGFDVYHREADFRSEASFRSRETGGGLRLGIPITTDLSVQPRYNFTRQEIFDVQPGASVAVEEAEGITNVSSVGYTLVYDARNHVQKPTQGVYASLAQDLAGVGGDVNYIRTVGDLRGYYPLRRGFTLVGRLQGGHIEAWGGDDDVRLMDLFFRGGETIRGFRRAGIGPRDLKTNDALGGKIFAAATTELRHPLPLVPETLGLSGAFFFDAGTLFDTGDIGTLNPKHVADDASIRSSAGFSLIWDSPLGPLRADFAVPITKEDYDRTEFFRFGASTQF